MEYEYIAGYSITTKSKDQCISEIAGWINNHRLGKYIVCMNTHSIVVAREDKLFDRAVKSADLAIPDGIGIILASKLLNGKTRRRITGTDIFLGVSNHLNMVGNYTYYFLGSTEEVLDRIKKKITADFPNIKVVGAYSPPFDSEFSGTDNQAMIDEINKSKPDVLWIGMTAPKQEKWVYKNIDNIEVKFVGPIGAVFDFYAGTKRRSSKLFQDLGLEWLPRMIREPKRMWRRVFISTPLFFAYVLKQRVRGGGV